MSKIPRLQSLQNRNKQNSAPKKSLKHDENGNKKKKSLIPRWNGFIEQVKNDILLTFKSTGRSIIGLVL